MKAGMNYFTLSNSTDINNMKRKAQQIALAKQFPCLFTYHPASDHLLPGFRWKHNRMHANLDSLDTLHMIELGMKPEDHDWFRTELWRAVTDDMIKPISATANKAALRSNCSASASHRLTAILKTLRIWEE